MLIMSAEGFFRVIVLEKVQTWSCMRLTIRLRRDEIFSTAVATTVVVCSCSQFPVNGVVDITCTFSLVLDLHS